MSFLQKTMIDADNERLACEYKLLDENVVILHGAGRASIRRYYSLAEEILRQGKGVVLFDFSGHGKSSGTLGELTLARRVAQARAVIDALVPTGTIYLAGFSMSGQTTCDLLPIYGTRIRSLLLACAAAYRPDIVDIPFGRAEFTAKLRQGRWQNTTAKANLAAWQGHTVVAIGAQDTVIPTGVTQLFKEAASDVSYIEYPGVDHSLATWLSDHPEQQKQLVEMLLR